MTKVQKLFGAQKSLAKETINKKNVGPKMYLSKTNLLSKTLGLGKVLGPKIWIQKIKNIVDHTQETL